EFVVPQLFSFLVLRPLTRPSATLSRKGRGLLIRLDFLPSPLAGEGAGGEGIRRTRSSIFLLIVRVHHFRVDDLALSFAPAGGASVGGSGGTGGGARRRRCTRAPGTRSSVHGLGQLVRRLRQAIHRSSDLRRVVSLDRLLRLLDRRLDALGVGVADLIAVFFEHLFGRVDHGVGVVFDLHLLFVAAVFVRMEFAFLRHALYFVLAEAAR